MTNEPNYRLTPLKVLAIEDVLPWLLGASAGASKKDGVERLDGVRLLLTAMARPSHLLCLAVRKEACEANQGSIAMLENRGWRVRIL